MSEFNIDDLDAVISSADSSLVQMLALQLKKQIGISKASEQQLAAVVAENAGLKGFGETLSEMHEGINGSGTGIQGEYEAVCQQVSLDAAMDAFDEIKTPATDAYLAEVRAQGVEQYAELFKGTVNMGIKHNQEFHHGTVWFAAQLRQGAKS